MLLNLNPSSGVPIYLQLMHQIKHAIETGALKPGEQLPSIRAIAEDLAMNPNTVARAFRELEHEGIIDVRHGSGAYVAELGTTAVKAAALGKAGEIMNKAVGRTSALGLSEPEIRRVFENQVTQLDKQSPVTRRRS